MVESLREKQAQNNPFDPNDPDEADEYGAFRAGWYTGYVSYYVVSLVAGGQATKAVKNSKTFGKIVDKLDRNGRVTKASQYLDATKARTTEPVKRGSYNLGARLGRGSVWLTKASGQRILSGTRTAAGQIRLYRSLRKIDDLSPSQESRLRTLLAHTGDDGVEGINRLDENTVDQLLDMRPSCGQGGLSTAAFGGSCLSKGTVDDFRESVVSASREGDFDSYEELGKVVRRIDSLDTEQRRQAIRFLAKTDTEGIEAFADLSNPGIRKLLSIIYRDEIDGDASLIDEDLNRQDMIELSSKGSVEDMLAIIKKNEGPEWRDGNKIWLEKGLNSKEAAELGKKPAGWKHLLEEHKGQFLDEPFVSDKEDIKEAIYKTVNKGNPHKIPDHKGGGTAYVYQIEGRSVTVIVGDNGYIVTARPGTPNI